MRLDNMRTLTLLAFSASIAIGCSPANYYYPVDATSSSSSSTTTSGTGGSDEEMGPCYTSSSDSTSAGGGLVIPECTEGALTILQGTIDGEPYQKTFHNTWYSGGEIGPPPWLLDFFFSSNGHIHMEWSQHTLPSYPMSVTGTLLVPGETKERELKPGSLLYEVCWKPWSFLILADGVELVGCATP